MGTMDEVRDETIEQNQDLPHVIFTVKDNKYALSSKYVLHLEVLGEVTPMVGMESYARGVILFHEEAVPVYDMRKLFGIRSHGEELAEFMTERMQDHENWVAALEKSVEDGTEFTLTTDPHMCKFGKWFDSYETDNNYFEMYIKTIEHPHLEVHETGKVVKKLMAGGKRDEAREAIKKMKATSYARTMNILREAAKVYVEGSKDMLIVLQLNDVKKSIVVDEICNVKFLSDMCSVPHNMSGSQSEYVCAIAKDRLPDGDTDLIFMFNIDML